MATGEHSERGVVVQLLVEVELDQEIDLVTIPNLLMEEKHVRDLQSKKENVVLRSVLVSRRICG